MAIDISTVTSLITEFRRMQAKDSITPELLGSILQHIADLIGTVGDITIEEIPDGIAYSIIPFDGFVTNAALNQQSILKYSTDSDTVVKYNSTTDRFIIGVTESAPTVPQTRIIGAVNYNYYNNWSDATLYGNADVNGCLPHKYKIYYDVSGGRMYRFDNGTLELIENDGSSYQPDDSIINVKNFGAMGDGVSDDTAALQLCIDLAYEVKKKIRIPAGEYLVTRALFVYDGIDIEGDGIYNTIIRTPFGKTEEAKAYVTRDKNKSYSSLTGIQPPEFDLATGHNRFYIGNGVVGYYDSDRNTNPSHPLYWPNDGSEEYSKWLAERSTIQSQGRWIGQTGREGYGGAVFKSSQLPGLRYESYENKQTRPYGIIHTGIRNVRFANLQINTNSTDRGKDSAIDFQYKSSTIPASIREKYDSSVLNIQLFNLYLFSLGKSGYRATRAVDHTIIGCYVRQAAEQGFYIDGVTSVFFTGCYCNSCTEGGYVLRGCNYCALNSCAADSCSIGYKLYKCNGVSLISCGAEATRYQKGEEGEEDPLKGRAFAIQSCYGVSLISPYTMTTHPKVYLEEITDISSEDMDENWNNSRHVFVSESKNVQICYPYFKCFQRIRRAAYTQADGTKVSYDFGAYNGSQKASRYWQVQNYLVGAQYEIRGEDSSVQIIASEKRETLCKESEVRTNNLDILDPGTVQNPLASIGLDTRGKTLSGDDGNGGWSFTVNGETYTVTLENFEFIFPINGKKQYNNRSYFWEWRNSLILVRKHTDLSLQANFSNKCYGYIDVLGSGPINWRNVSDSMLSRFSIDIIDDYDTSLIDGSKSLYSYGTFAFSSDEKPIAYEPSVYSPIPALVRDKPEGHRITINSDTIDKFPVAAGKASVSIIGFESKDSQTPEEVDALGSALVVLTRRKSRHMTSDGDYKAMQVINLDGAELFSVLEKNGSGKSISVADHQIISTSDADFSCITKPSTSASTEVLASTIGALIDRLTAHGFIKEPDNSIEFEWGSSTFASDSATLQFKVISDMTIYRAGLAYSSSNMSPTYGSNNTIATFDANTDYWEASLTYGNTGSRYVRIFVELTAQGGESSRVYSETYILEQGSISIL